MGGIALAGYVYNGRGERVKKSGAAVTYYQYDPAGQLMAELDGAGNTIREYVYLNGSPLALIEGSNIYTVHTDHLGTPQVITDASQAVAWQADYSPFGEAAITTNLVTNNLRFPGQYFDQETGLHYNYFRDYDPSIGRYIEGDPIGLGGGLNIYAYTDSNPLRYTDPSGQAIPQALGLLLRGAAALRACLKIKACKEKVKDALKNCKDVRCEVKRERPDHKFPDQPKGQQWCVHIRLTCYIKGKGGRKLFDAQWPVGQCFETKQTPNKQDPFPRDFPG